MVIHIIAKIDGKTFDAPVRSDSLWNARATFLRFYPAAQIELMEIDPNATEAERAQGL